MCSLLMASLKRDPEIFVSKIGLSVAAALFRSLFCFVSFRLDFSVALIYITYSVYLSIVGVCVCARACVRVFFEPFFVYLIKHLRSTLISEWIFFFTIDCCNDDNEHLFNFPPKLKAKILAYQSIEIERENARMKPEHTVSKKWHV